MGDLDYVAKDLRLENQGSHQRCCLCKANTSDVPWTHIADAAWQGTVYTSRAAWAASHPNACMLFLALGISAINYFVDLMHCKHLGIDQMAYGSLIMFIVNTLLPNAPAANLKKFWGQIVAAYKAHARMLCKPCLSHGLLLTCIHLICLQHVVACDSCTRQNMPLFLRRPSRPTTASQT